MELSAYCERKCLELNIGGDGREDTSLARGKVTMKGRKIGGKEKEVEDDTAVAAVAGEERGSENAQEIGDKKKTLHPLLDSALRVIAAVPPVDNETARALPREALLLRRSDPEGTERNDERRDVVPREGGGGGGEGGRESREKKYVYTTMTDLDAEFYAQPWVEDAAAWYMKRLAAMQHQRKFTKGRGGGEKGEGAESSEEEWSLDSDFDFENFEAVLSSDGEGENDTKETGSVSEKIKGKSGAENTRTGAGVGGRRKRARKVPTKS